MELNALCDGDTVLGDLGRSPRLFDGDVAALGAESHLDGVGQLVHAGKHASASGDLGACMQMDLDTEAETQSEQEGRCEGRAV